MIAFIDLQEEISVCGCDENDLCNVDATCPTYCESTTLSTTSTTTTVPLTTGTETVLPTTTSGNCMTSYFGHTWHLKHLQFQ